MRTIVVAAGAVGNATAFYLHKRGHEVVVIERQPGATLETSRGNGGVVHTSEVEPWSQPGMPRKILSWLGQENAPLLLRYGAIPHLWRCTPAMSLCSRPRSAGYCRRHALYRSNGRNSGPVAWISTSGLIMVTVRSCGGWMTAISN